MEDIEETPNSPQVRFAHRNSIYGIIGTPRMLDLDEAAFSFRDHMNTLHHHNHNQNNDFQNHNDAHYDDKQHHQHSPQQIRDHNNNVNETQGQSLTPISSSSEEEEQPREQQQEDQYLNAQRNTIHNNVHVHAHDNDIDAETATPSESQCSFPANTFEIESESLLYKDKRKDMQGRILHEKVMRNYNCHQSSLSNMHVWSIVFVKSLNHLMRKYFEYFAYYIVMESAAFNINSFMAFGIGIASMDMASIFCQVFLIPFLISNFVNVRYSPHYMQCIYQFAIACSILVLVWWNSFVGFFLLRFVFGIGYALLLNNWSLCISSFVSPSKQISAIGRMELSWAFASFAFILIAYIMDVAGIQTVLCIFSGLAFVSAFVLLKIMPAAQFAHANDESAQNMRMDTGAGAADFHGYIRQHIHDNDNYGDGYTAINDTSMGVGVNNVVFQPQHNRGVDFRSNCFIIIETLKEICVEIYCGDVVCMLFLATVILVTFVNTMLILLLAFWLSTDYALSISEFGYCTIIIGTAQLISIFFSYQYQHKLGIGWSLLAGILAQFLVFAVLLVIFQFFEDGDIDAAANEKSGSSYTLPLLLILLLLCIHFIAAEFTTINFFPGMIHFTPVRISSSMAANALNIVTSVGRIFGAVLAAWIWFWGRSQFYLFIEIACICLGIALALYLGLMVYVTCVLNNHDRNADDEQYVADEEQQSLLSSISRTASSSRIADSSHSNSHSQARHWRSESLGEEQLPFQDIEDGDRHMNIVGSGRRPSRTANHIIRHGLDMNMDMKRVRILCRNKEEEKMMRLQNINMDSNNAAIIQLSNHNELRTTNGIRKNNGGADGATMKTAGDYWTNGGLEHHSSGYYRSKTQKYMQQMRAASEEHLQRERDICEHNNENEEQQPPDTSAVSLP